MKPRTDNSPSKYYSPMVPRETPKTMLGVFLGDADRDRAYETLITCPANAVELLRMASREYKLLCGRSCERCLSRLVCVHLAIDAALRECGGE